MCRQQTGDRKRTLRELVDETVDESASLGFADELAEFWRRQSKRRGQLRLENAKAQSGNRLACRLEIKVSVPGELLALRPPNDIRRHALKLPQRGHRSPHALLDHLTQGERLVRQRGPASLEADFKDRAKDPTGRLRHVDHVGDECEAVELELRDVRLEEHVDLRRGVVDAFLDGDRYSFKELGEFEPTKGSAHVNKGQERRRRGRGGKEAPSLLLLSAHWHIFELLRDRKHAEELDKARRRLEVLVVGAHGGVRDVVTAGDSAELVALCRV
jgi:hypothetical protein